MALSNTNFDGLLSAMAPVWVRSNYGNLFKQHSPVFKMFAMAGRIKPADYGLKQVEPLITPVVTGPQLTGVTDSFADVDYQPMTGYTAAEFILSQKQILVAVDDYDLKRFGPEAEKVRWVEAQFKNALLRSYNAMLVDFWRDPSDALSIGTRTNLASIRTLLNCGLSGTTTDGGAQPSALAEQQKTGIVGTSGATVQYTVGNIPRNAAGAAYYCTPVYGTDKSAAAVSITELSRIYNLALRDGNEVPNLGVTHPDVMDKIQNLLSVGGSSGGQFFQDSALAKAGFNAVRFRGMEIVTDRRCPTSGYVSGTTTLLGYHFFAINMNHISLKQTSKEPKFTEVPDRRAIKGWSGLWYGCFTMDDPGPHAIHCNLSVA